MSDVRYVMYYQSQKHLTAKISNNCIGLKFQCAWDKPRHVGFSLSSNLVKERRGKVKERKRREEEESDKCVLNRAQNCTVWRWSRNRAIVSFWFRIPPFLFEGLLSDFFDFVSVRSADWTRGCWSLNKQRFLWRWSDGRCVGTGILEMLCGFWLIRKS